ncbi:serine hydrolase domain-containing protein [Paraflavitalea sp. CAU 1676]|uniref:serine hydrolase domain-containing protein n=1 Tax=Paraflavitalea sp. CAU 1676 TaxID=3032598 RepID=UPI0023D9B3DB|nr:serine hydrolase domain-containing protein [Paraflavitalea sp. CAU 1676]MDF2192455.1 serine hydrolase [Paraflavitalea sp. CAU 1676]
MKYPIQLLSNTLSVIGFLLVLQTGLAQDKLTTRFDSVMNAYDRLNWNAMVLVGNTDTILYQRSIGFSNRNNQTPFTNQTLFHTASTGKMFTATRIMQLVNEGKINLSQPVKSLLPQWTLPNLERINIHHLLTHTSGLASAWDHPDYDFKKNYTPAQVKKMMEEVPLVFKEPGERFSYSNIGYTLLGDIIARCDGMPFGQSINKYILAPAGITNGDYANITHAAVPYYQVGAGRFVIDEEMLISQPRPGEGAGGWIMGPVDLYKFVKAYLKNTYLDSSAQSMQSTANHTVDSTKNNYRYGLSVLTGKFANFHLIYGHNGGGKGFSVDAFFDPHSKMIVVMASNQYASSYTISQNLFRVLYGEPIIYPRHNSTIRIIEGMRKQGKDVLINQPDSFFARINVTPNDYLFSMTYFLLDLDKDYAGAADLLAVGRSKFPQAGYMWFNSGLNAVKQQQPQVARQFFTKAKEIGTTGNDPILVEQASAELKTLVKGEAQ